MFKWTDKMTALTIYLTVMLFTGNAWANFLLSRLGNEYIAFGGLLVVMCLYHSWYTDVIETKLRDEFKFHTYFGKDK